ncbi:hypothetical protein AXW84_08850 [Hymenobacter sp. PAMC 26628]|nr:hypothetical protein AXW84_08850 [Hymenobacter sp. PAMC 26628]
MVAFRVFRLAWVNALRGPLGGENVRAALVDFLVGGRAVAAAGPASGAFAEGIAIWNWVD